MLGRRLLIWCWASTALAGWGGQVLAQERSLSDLAFMSGCWRGKLAKEDGTIEERHNPPAAGVMLGTSQVIVGGKTTFFELIKIEQSSEGISMNPFPMGNKSVAFKLVSSGPNKAVFENLEHDFPKRILYQLRDDGSLVARIEGGRPEQTEEFVMKAVACEAGAPVQPSTAAAQEPPKSPDQRKLLEEINRDIWIPFTQAYATGNADQYLGLHSRDFIRGQGAPGGS